MASITLYPPILDSWMPSFIIDEGCIIRFNLSNFNSIENINASAVQVSIRDGSNNKSVIKQKQSADSTEIIFKKLQYNITEDYYYIIIYNNDVKDGFIQNKYYKVQLRFTDNSCSATNPTPSWLSSNLDHFSEWSTVCLIKGFKKPTIQMKNLNNSTRLFSFSTDAISFIGEMNFQQGEKETLSSYRFMIDSFYDSGEIYTEEYSPNVINHNVAYSLSSLVGGYVSTMVDDLGDVLVDADNEAILAYGKTLTENNYYNVYFIYTTSNGYTHTEVYQLDIVLSQNQNFNGTIDIVPNEEEGFNVLNVKSENTLGRKQLVIRRTSSESRFLVWEDLAIFSYSAAAAINQEFIDRTVKSGVWYQYDVTTVNAGLRDNTVRSEVVINNFSDAFLVIDNKQLKIQFDNKMNSFKYNVLESKVDTLGGQYPIIRRNGDVYYRAFPITGTISYHMDEAEQFLKKIGLYGQAITNKYDNYNIEHEINPLYDYIYERDFRQQVMKFLQTPSVKLFKSMTEGNIVVRLMDISFTPNDTLDRLVYGFTAMAYEVADDSITNYDKYGIQKIRR